MKTRSSVILVLTTALLLFSGATSFAQQSIFHDPWLNWDFINFNGSPATNFEIIFDNPNYNPNPNDPTQILLGAPFLSCTVTHGDNNGDGRPDTMLTWSGGAPVGPGIIAHVGGDMRGSGRILDAYWTDVNGKLGPSLAISYELTEIRPAGSGEIHMQLQIAPGWYDEPVHYGESAGWKSVRTFRNIPANVLDLEDLNRNYLTPAKLQELADAGYEVTPFRGQPGVPGYYGLPIQPTDILWGVPDSFFDVYLDTVPDIYLGPQYESLLVAEVVNQGQVIGQFWNLNPQSPEPTALALLALGALALAGRRPCRN